MGSPCAAARWRASPKASTAREARRAPRSASRRRRRRTRLRFRMGFEGKTRLCRETRVCFPVCFRRRCPGSCAASLRRPLVARRARHPPAARTPPSRFPFRCARRGKRAGAETRRRTSPAPRRRISGGAPRPPRTTRAWWSCRGSWASTPCRRRRSPACQTRSARRAACAGCANRRCRFPPARAARTAGPSRGPRRTRVVRYTR
mmetsp:Transcript_15933/g.67163  ORF Transcript_15933/g.67163 Transcript_15933/m.67163 type:complete len:204 (-) Transcript_15933:959-1570(-)